MSSSTPLNYAPPPPLHQRRAFGRWLLITFLLGIGAICVWWGPAIWTRLQLLYWQHRCMVYLPPNGQIAMAADSKGVISQSIPAEWTRFYSLLSPPGFSSDGTVFLHELKKHDGQRRLVVVDVVILDRKTDGVLPFARVIIPGDLTTLPKEKPLSGATDRLTLVGPKRLTIYAGSIDPGDSSRFIFRANVQGKEIIYDGWLRDDDAVVINQRTPKN